ncbi:desumoylating isopeptidase [Acrasis kona]|uniref:Desumoylating isopeptidase n=1 Tax=Acrasis kona TaxID=1008807 RepID=A0AAW2ZJG1_9EUKA
MKSKVILHVYDLNPQYNSLSGAFGLGTYHTGVEVFGAEYTFGEGGITNHGPKQADNGDTCIYNQSIELGETDLMRSDMSGKVTAKLKKDGFLGRNYDPLAKNCNHFSDALAKILLETDKGVIPNWINRSSTVGNWFKTKFQK